MKRLISLLIIIGIISYGTYILVNYIQLIMKKRGLQEKTKECVELVFAGTSSVERARSDLRSYIKEKNINVDTTEVKLDRYPQFTFAYISYYDSLVFPFFKKTKIIYFDYEIAETLYVK